MNFLRACITDSAGTLLKLAPVHVRLQRFLLVHRRALVELPRDHGKSTQVCGRILWELGRNPALRVKIVCATDAIAIQRCRYLRDQIERNKLLREIFPHLRAGRPWRAESFSIARPGDVIGPSVQAFGVGAGSTGTRADLLVCDDIVDVRSLHSRSERRRVIDYFHENLMNLLEPDGRFWGLFTPWHHDDLNARLKKNGAYALFREAVGPDFEPVWEEKWPAGRLRDRKSEIGSHSFARGYQLQPVAGEETAIRPGWVRYWHEPAEYEQVILVVDPAVSTAERADRSALVVLGKIGGGWPGRRLCDAPESASRGFEDSAPATQTGSTPNSAPQIHVLAARAARLAAPDLVALIDHLDHTWNPSVIVFESNAAFLGMRDLLARHARFGHKMKGVTQTADKAARIAAFSVVVENGAFRLLGDTHGVAAPQRELYEEMIGFPFVDLDDLVDAAATGTQYLLTQREPMIW